MLYTLKLLLIALTLWSGYGQASDDLITVNGTQVPFNLAAHGHYLIDPEGELDLTDVRSMDVNGRWQQAHVETPNFGFSSDTIWARYRLIPTDDTFNQAFIEIGYPLLDNVDVQIFENGTIVAQYAVGDAQPFTERPIKHRNFLIPVALKQNNRYEIYLRVKTTSSLQFPVTLWEQTRFWESDGDNTLNHVLYLGAMGIMLFYNLFLLFYLKERAYLYYVGFVLGTIGFQTGLDGFAFQRFFPGHPLLQAKIVSVSITFQMIMATLFAKHFLCINKERGSMNKAAVSMVGLGLLLMIAAVFLPYASVIQPVSIGSAIFCSFWLGSGIYEWKRGNQSARLFVFAWASLVTGVVVLALNKNGVVPRLFFTENALVLGTLGQVLLFSLALASRINQERDEKEKAARAALVANQQAVANLSKVQALYEQSLDGMFKCNQKGEFTHANPAMAKILGFADVDALMQSGFSFKEDMFANLDELTELFRLLRKDGAANEFDAELFNRNRDYFWGSLSVRMEEDEQGKRKCFEGSLRDISVRREKEKAELERKAAYEASQAKSFFLANMSHEIRTPLTAIIGFAESIRDGGLNKSEEQSYIGTIIRNSQHLLHVINEILDSSKIEAKKLDIEVIKVDLFEIVREVQSCCEIKAREKGLDFNVVYEFPLPQQIFTDQTRIKQVLLNLTSNALKFTEKGSITITVFMRKEQQQVGFRVQDTGVGMTQDQQSRVFDAFMQADTSTTRMYGGTGLGLSIAKQLAELMGGDITVASQPDVGSTFEVLINHGDLADVDWVSDMSNAGLTQETPSEPIKMPKLTGKILYAEDNVDNQSLVSMLVKPTGAELKIVKNGAEAMAEALKHQYDLILMDIQMPMMSGTTATRLLRENGYQNPIIAMTANLMDYEIKEYLEVGCNGYLSKPVQKSRFYEVLSLYLSAAKSESDTGTAEATLPQFAGSILIAEDIADNRALFSRKFKNYGLQVTTVEDGTKAVESALAGDFNLVLMDLNMPNMGGEEAVGLLRASGYQEPIVALTAEDDSTTIQRLLSGGFSGHLLKPIEDNALIAVMQEHLTSAEKAAEQSENAGIYSDPEFQALVDNYVSGLGNYTSQLNEAFVAQDWESLRSLAHQLKGSGGSFGFECISVTARDLEMVIKQNELQEIPEKLDKLLHEIGVVCSQSLDDSMGILG